MAIPPTPSTEAPPVTARPDVRRALLLLLLLVGACSHRAGANQDPPPTSDGPPSGATGTLVALSAVVAGDCIQFTSPPSAEVYVGTCGDRSVHIVGEVGPLHQLPSDFPGDATSAGMLLDACADSFARSGTSARTVVTLPGPEGWAAAREHALCGISEP